MRDPLRKDVSTLPACIIHGVPTAGPREVVDVTPCLNHFHGNLHMALLCCAWLAKTRTAARGAIPLPLPIGNTKPRLERIRGKTHPRANVCPSLAGRGAPRRSVQPLVGGCRGCPGRRGGLVRRAGLVYAPPYRCR